MTDFFYHGLSVDFWAPIQTLTPPPKFRHISWYPGFSHYGFYPGDTVEEIPLPIRYASFKRRLKLALAR